MPQNQDFGFELASRLEAVAQHPNKRRPIAIMLADSGPLRRFSRLIIELIQWLPDKFPPRHFQMDRPGTDGDPAAAAFFLRTWRQGS